MPAPWPRVFRAASSAAKTVLAAAETVAETVSGISTAGEGEQITIMATVSFTAGTAATALDLNIRRGTDATGTVVGTLRDNALNAGREETWTVAAVDTPGEVADQSYVVTVEQESATGNGTVNSAVLTAVV